ncbi:hypothetical protein EON81_17935, partial [bacterium]
PEPAPEVTSAPERPSLGRIAAFVWAGGAGLLSLHLLLGYASLFRLRRRCRTVALDDVLAPICAELHVRKPMLVAGEEVTNPFVAGTIRPTVYLPARLLGTEELVPILRHEAAHLAGNDLRWSLLHRLALILLWPQPLLWLLKRPVEAASETLCDGQVLAGGVSARSYASCLLNLRETAAPRVPIGIGAVGNRSSFARRIEAILGGRIAIRLSTPVRMGVFGLTLVLAGSASLLAFGQEEVKPTLSRAPFGEWVKTSGAKIAVKPVELLNPMSGTSYWSYELLSQGQNVFDWKGARAEVSVDGKWHSANFEQRHGDTVVYLAFEGSGEGHEQREIVFPAETGALPPGDLRLTLPFVNSRAKPLVLVFDRTLVPKARADGRRVKIRLLTAEGFPLKNAWATVHYDPFAMRTQDLLSFSWGGEAIPVINGVAEAVLPKKADAERPILLVKAPGCGLSILRLDWNETEYELRMAKPIEAVGRILKPDGTPAVGVRIVAQDIRFENQRSSGVAWNPGVDIPGQFSTPADANGEVRIGGLPQGATVTFARLDDRYAPLPLPALKLPKKDRMTLPTVRLQKSAKIAGRVLWRGKGIPGSLISIDKIGAPGPNYFSTTSDPDGSYRIGGLAPGHYNLSLIPRNRRQPWIARGFSKIRIAEGQFKKGVDFVGESGGVITGRVLNAKGKPISGLELVLNHGYVIEKDQFLMMSDVTDKNGRYEIRVPPGHYPIEVVRSNLPKGTGPFPSSKVTVKTGRTSEVNFKAK